MSNSGSEDDVNPDDEQDKDVDDEDEEEQQDDPSLVDLSSAETPQRSTRAPNVRLSTSSGLDLYSYGPNMSDKQRREQDERNFAKAAEKERKSKSIVDSKRRIRFDANGNLQYSEDPENSEWRECSKSYARLTTSNTPLEPAVFHHWIRRELAEAANRRGRYGRPLFISTVSAQADLVSSVPSKNRP